MEETLASHMPNTTARAAADNLIILLLASFVLHGFFYYWPVYLWPRYAQDYEQVSPTPHLEAIREDLHNALILLPSSDANAFRYSSGFIYNDPFLSNDVIYARDLGKDNECLFEAFPGRQIYQFIPGPDWQTGTFRLLSNEKINRTNEH